MKFHYYNEDRSPLDNKWCQSCCNNRAVAWFWGSGRKNARCNTCMNKQNVLGNYRRSTYVERGVKKNWRY